MKENNGIRETKGELGDDLRHLVENEKEMKEFLTKNRRQTDRAATVGRYFFIWFAIGMAVVSIAVVLWNCIRNGQLPDGNVIFDNACVLGIAIACVSTWFKLDRRVDEGKIFTEENASLIQKLGKIVEVLGIMMFFGHVGKGDTTSFVYCLPLLVGCLMDLIGYMIYRGIKMQQEQELTV